MFENSSLIIDSVKAAGINQGILKAIACLFFLTLSHCLQDYVF